MADAIVPVAVDAPRHARLAATLDYRCERVLEAGTLVRVPLGRREVAGIVWKMSAPQLAAGATLRPIADHIDAIAPLAPAWMALVEFAASYYQRAVGEVALAALPSELRRLNASQVAARVRRSQRGASASVAPTPARTRAAALTDEQAAALAAIDAAAEQRVSAPLLLHGVTGSGKTEVYLQAAEQALARGRQVLLLVPEINLTPQLLARVAERFPTRRVVAMHSALTAPQRLQNWLLAHAGRADLVLGTRLAVFASLPRLGLVVVDEEHDASYKQQEGARYSARDLAIYRGHLEHVPVVLGSATPSLETWQQARSGRYQRLPLRERIGGAALPRVRLFDMASLPRAVGQAPPTLAPPVLEALRLRAQRGEQGLVFLNRRGYAPVLHCPDCGWKSECPHCSAWRVFHKVDRTLRCHHCGLTEQVPRACPTCGNLDIQPIGRGTEKLAEQLAAELPQARIARLDADTARGRGALEHTLAAVHAGEVDILVGTQIVTKGHDFRRITLVVAVNPDTALFSSDFRAGERQFALLMQAAGRAGREAAHSLASEMWVQTWHPQHALFAALQRHDYALFAERLLAERHAAGLPPFAHLALLRAAARDGATAGSFLHEAAALASSLPTADGVTVYPPVPLAVPRVANIERMQMLVESPSRGRLQRFLTAWLPQLHELRGRVRGLARWAIDVDPLAI
ncbi:MAG TPA: primosomal protein N' [Burkholderiaceae bacterium]|nr:primosomal protein N' [Burkholderiaceae bacterium]